jgi:hypothetical protein
MIRTSFGILCAVIILANAVSGGKVHADDLSGAYLGGNFGRARNSYASGFIDDQIASSAAGLGDTVTYAAKSVQRMSDAWWFDTGYLFTPYFGVEAAFLHIGEIRYVAVGKIDSSIRSLPLETTTEVISHGPALSLILRLPLTESFEADVRLGDYFGKATLDTNITVGPKNQFTDLSESSSGLLAGVGASYSIDGHWSFRIDYLRVNDIGDSNTTGKFSVNLASAGVSFTF